MEYLSENNSASVKGSSIVASLLVGLGFVFPELVEAATAIPGEAGAGFFYSITHMHPAAYVILFLIFVLSVLNLVFQGRLRPSSGPFKWLSTVLRKSGDHGIRSIKAKTGSLIGAPRGRKVDPQLQHREGTEDSVVRVRRIEKTGDSAAVLRTPTPLDGVNHPMPQFGTPVVPQTGAPRILNSKPSKKTTTEFKFSSAVDVPTEEEMERRVKEQIVVSGAVKGPDGKGIGSVIVYLTDEDGNRMGQSSRSVPETGEFKVLIHEQGKYILNGYKRGYIMENSEPLLLPIESGKIEGFMFKMIPEGCIVHGRLISQGPGRPVSNVEVKCICGNGEFERTSRSESSGDFKITGVLANSKCFIEVRDSEGKLLVDSEPFETVQKKEIFREIVIPAGVTNSNYANKKVPLDSGDRESEPDAKIASVPGT